MTFLHCAFCLESKERILVSSSCYYQELAKSFWIEACFLIVLHFLCLVFWLVSVSWLYLGYIRSFTISSVNFIRNKEDLTSFVNFILGWMWKIWSMKGLCRTKKGPSENVAYDSDMMFCLWWLWWCRRWSDLCVCVCGRLWRCWALGLGGAQPISLNHYIPFTLTFPLFSSCFPDFLGFSRIF